MPIPPCIRQQELELANVMKEHWKEQFFTENKRYRFHYQLVQKHLQTIDELKSSQCAEEPI